MNADTLFKICLIIYVVSGIVLAVLGFTHERVGAGAAFGVAHLATLAVLGTGMVLLELKERRRKPRPY